MKRIKLLAVLFALLMSANMNGTNYFTLCTGLTTPVNDTLRISPTDVDSYCDMYAAANFDGYLDHWFVQFNHPGDMPIDDRSCYPDSDMSVPYTMINGTDSVFSAILTKDHLNTPVDGNRFSSAFSSTSTVYGYWDPDDDGQYDMYGTVKWEIGYHSKMFRFGLYIPDGCTGGSIGISCTLSSTTDWRGYPTVSGTFNKTLYFKVAYLRGDANGDNVIAVDDIGTLQHWVMDGCEGADPYRLAAGDMDGDGEISTHDITLLTSYVLQN